LRRRRKCWWTSRTNPQAAAQLAGWLRAHPKRTRAVFGALRDKDVDAVVARWIRCCWNGTSPASTTPARAAAARSCSPARLAPRVDAGRLHLHHDAAPRCARGRRPVRPMNGCWCSAPSTPSPMPCAAQGALPARV
jgi:hypothetical protein